MKHLKIFEEFSQNIHDYLIKDLIKKIYRYDLFLRDPFAWRKLWTGSSWNLSYKLYMALRIFKDDYSSEPISQIEYEKLWNEFQAVPPKNAEFSKLVYAIYDNPLEAADMYNYTPEMIMKDHDIDKNTAEIIKLLITGIHQDAEWHKPEID